MLIDFGMIKIVNKSFYDGDGEVVHRPSPLGNPWSHKHSKYKDVILVGSRAEAVLKYREWLPEQLKSDTPQKREFDRLFEKLKREGELVLICWCFPRNCHSFVIKELLLERLKNEEVALPCIRA